MQFQIYSNVYDSIGKAKNLDWTEWKKIFSRHVQLGDPTDTDNKEKLDSTKLKAKALLLGIIKNRRKTENVRAITSLALDLENLSLESLKETLLLLRPWEWIAYSTHKSQARAINNAVRLRVILPLKTEIAPDQFPAAWDRLNNFVKLRNDPKTKDLARLHFLPSTFDLSVAWTCANKGRFLEPFSDLPEPRPQLAAPSLPDQLLTSIRNKARVLLLGDPIKALLKRLLNGEPLAEQGNRHATILQLTQWLALRYELSPEQLATIFTPSLARTTTDGGPVTQDEIWKAYEGARKKLTTEAPGQSYTAEELAQIAQAQGVEVDELKQRWILQKQGGGWVLDATGNYRGYFSKEDFPIQVRKLLARAPIQFTAPQGNSLKRRSLPDLVVQHGAIVEEIFSDLTIKTTTWNAEARALHEACAPLRADLVPKHNHEIEVWLKLIAGHLYEKLADWLSVCPDLSKLLCALYFDGPANSGKSMLAHGLSRLWSEGGPSKVTSILAHFNGDLARCPLVLADEELPYYQHQSASSILREVLATTSHVLTRKFRPESTLKGALRIVLAANNEFLLRSSSVSSQNDLEAIAQRFLYVPIGNEAAQFVEILAQDKSKLQRWIERGIAEHTLYLAANRTIAEPGKRFAVEGDISAMHRLLISGTKWNSLVCEWLVRYLISPHQFDSDQSGLIVIHEGQLLVNEQALVDQWTLYLNLKLEPETARIGAALRSISLPGERRQLRRAGRRVRYRVIDPGYLVSWAEQHGIGDGELIQARLAGAAPLYRDGGAGRDTNVDDLNDLDRVIQETLS